MRLPMLSVRGKIMGTVILVSTLVAALGAWSASEEVRSTRGEGRYLTRHWERYRSAASDLGTAEYAVVRLVAGDPAILAGLEAADPAPVAEAGKRAVEALQGTLAPDLLTISDAAGVRLGGTGLALPESEWRNSRLFQDLREGRPVRAKYAVLGGKAYRVSGAPVRRGERVLGTVLLGQLLDAWFAEVAGRSASDDPEKQHRISLVTGSTVLASALPKKEWPNLLAAVRKPATAREGEIRVPVLEMGDKGAYDFWSEPAYGYDRSGDPDTTQIGTFYLVRSRLHRTSEVQNAIWDVLGVFAAALAVAIIMGYVLAVQITRPLKQYIFATEELTRGHADLSKRLAVKTHDELGSLARNLNRVFAKIHSLAAGVQRSAFQVNASSGEISTVSKQMHDGAKEQAGKISNSTAAVTELSSSIQQVAENAAEASRTAKQSGEAVTRAIARLGQIRNTVEDAAGRIGMLGESGKRIGNIVEVIRQISEQTTMLALNAAIEAAHAGEHGRGFAVVADEVSSLAKRVGQSARDIEDLIATIRDQTGEAVRVMQDGSREVEEGTGLVENTLADLKTLVSVIDDTASAVQEQAIASDEIARNMDAVQRIAQSVLSSSENAVVQGDRLQKLADELEHSVRGFRIDPERVALDEMELKSLPEARP
ncbi:MAG TPA: methyl-accepting chemotaxis protein [Polyangiaceae bacterium]